MGQSDLLPVAGVPFGLPAGALAQSQPLALQPGYERHHCSSLFAAELQSGEVLAFY